MLYCKKNVRFGKFRKTGIYILEKLDTISDRLKQDMWITSANDSNHRLHSLHYLDKAFDIRTRHLDMEEFMKLTATLYHAEKLSLILFEWREKVKGRWVKHKARYGGNSFLDEFEHYLNCKNEKVSHLHVEW